MRTKVQLAAFYRGAEDASGSLRVAEDIQAYLATVMASYGRLEASTGLRVVFVSHDPYQSQAEMADQVRSTGQLLIYTGASDGLPWTPSENAAMRAVHDGYDHLGEGSLARERSRTLDQSKGENDASFRDIHASRGTGERCRVQRYADNERIDAFGRSRLQRGMVCAALRIDGADRRPSQRMPNALALYGAWCAYEPASVRLCYDGGSGEPEDCTGREGGAMTLHESCQTMVLVTAWLGVVGWAVGRLWDWTTSRPQSRPSERETVPAPHHSPAGRRVGSPDTTSTIGRPCTLPSSPGPVAARQSACGQPSRCDSVAQVAAPEGNAFRAGMAQLAFARAHAIAYLEGNPLARRLQREVDRKRGKMTNGYSKGPYGAANKLSNKARRGQTVLGLGSDKRPDMAFFRQSGWSQGPGGRCDVHLEGAVVCFSPAVLP